MAGQAYNGDRFRRPFDGRPKTELVSPFGPPVYRITVRALTPLRAILRDLVWIPVAAAGFFGFANLSSIVVESGFGFLQPVCGAMAWLSIPLAWPLAHLLLMKTTELTIDMKSVRAKGWQSWRRYDRMQPHSFALYPHDWTKGEESWNKRRAEKAQLEGKTVRRQRPWDRSG